MHDLPAGRWQNQFTGWEATSMRESIATPRVLRFGVFELDARGRELRKQGAHVRLTDQPFQVLVCLVEHAGEVVTRDELRQKLWPSSVFVDFDHGLNNAIAKVRDALGDSPVTSRFIETLPRLGYRFICPVENVPVVPRVIDKGTTAGAELQSVQALPLTTAAPPSSTRSRVMTFGIVAVLVALALLTAAWLVRQPVEEARFAGVSTEPSIAVLPFVNLSDDVEKEHFADGLSEELLNTLAGIRGLKVVGRTSASYFKDKDVPPRVIAEALNVNHLLEGSVRRSGSRVRVTVQLIDARNGYHRWSQTYDREFTDIFQIQEDIALSVAATLRVKLMDADEIRLHSRGTRDAEAYRLYVTALTQLTGVAGGRNTERAKALLEQALTRDPDFAAAHAGLALILFNAASTTLDALEDDARLGRAAAERAVAIDPESSEALASRANFAFWRYRFRGEFEAYSRMHEDFRRAIELDPSNPFAFFDYARAVQWDEPDLAMKLFERAAELDPVWNDPHVSIASLLSRRGLYDAARKRLGELAAQSVGNPNDVIFGAHVGSLERHLGRLDEAVAPLCRGGGGAGIAIQCWSLYMSLGDNESARHVLEDFRGNAVTHALHDAASLIMDARYEEAFDSLDRHRNDFPLSRVLDLPTARFALIAGHDEHARALLELRLPDLVRGVEPVRARSVIPALDLAEAYSRTGRQPEADRLLGRIVAFLDGSDAPRLPMFLYLRARAHALANEPEEALEALERAYAEGFRMIWALDLNPQPLFYIDSIDVDPAFAALRGEPRYKRWRESIGADNARQLERLRAHGRARPVA